MRLLFVVVAVSMSLVAEAAEPQAGALAEAVRLFHAEELEAAEALLLDVRQARPENAEAAFYLGRVHLASGRAQAAVQAIEEAARLDPGSSAYQFWLGEALVARLDEIPVLFKLGFANRIRTAYEKAVELDPENLDARAAVARYHLRAPPIAGGDPRIADEQIEEIRRRDPALARVLIGEREGRPEAAAETSVADAAVGWLFCHGF